MTASIVFVGISSFEKKKIIPFKRIPQSGNEFQRFGFIFMIGIGIPFEKIPITREYTYVYYAVLEKLNENALSLNEIRRAGLVVTGRTFIPI